tara:strand:- start:2863 stop:3477 length:615 start_codon:yes stop_codon:yes gene_type:complete
MLSRGGLETITPAEWHGGETVSLRGGGEMQKVQLSPKGFYTSIVKLKETTELVTSFTPTVVHTTSTFKLTVNPIEEEAPFLSVEAVGDKMPAASVELVFYSRNTLEEDKWLEEAPEEFFLVYINASPYSFPVPLTPMAMCRNQLAEDWNVAMEGGTRREYTSDEWAEAIRFWSTHAQVQTPGSSEDQRMTQVIERLRELCLSQD